MRPPRRRVGPSGRPQLMDTVQQADHQPPLVADQSTAKPGGQTPALIKHRHRQRQIQRLQTDVRRQPPGSIRCAPHVADRVREQPVLRSPMPHDPDGRIHEEQPRPPRGNQQPSVRQHVQLCRTPIPDLLRALEGHRFHRIPAPSQETGTARQHPPSTVHRRSHAGHESPRHKRVGGPGHELAPIELPQAYSGGLRKDIRSGHHHAGGARSIREGPGLQPPLRPPEHMSLRRKPDVFPRGRRLPHDTELPFDTFRSLHQGPKGRPPKGIQPHNPQIIRPPQKDGTVGLDDHRPDVAQRRFKPTELVTVVPQQQVGRREVQDAVGPHRHPRDLRTRTILRRAPGPEQRTSTLCFLPEDNGSQEGEGSNDTKPPHEGREMHPRKIEAAGSSAQSRSSVNNRRGAARRNSTCPSAKARLARNFVRRPPLATPRSVSALFSFPPLCR